jgi:hypothetical protein
MYDLRFGGERTEGNWSSEAGRFEVYESYQNTEDSRMDRLG